ncbi:nuclear transport factor 2 family protein [Streptomyces sp. ISL-87]|nr:nuclear transport factor 2 family protein [Streptomyces sp. ISL-21]MBT2612652.1 nuclear transport factor 2 family protein [Streptomyces sp. ISL-87]
MPEGDNVWRAAARLHAALAGRELTRCDLRVPRLATTDLTGRTTLNVTARGKHLLARFSGDRDGDGSDGLTLHSHLRMDGAWHVFTAGQKWRGGPAHEIRAILGTPAHTAVGYRLPVLELLRTSDEDRVVGHLGPDLLGPDWDPDKAAANLLAAPDRALGEALLDQRNLAGIGNIYKAELCFLAQVTPWTPVGALPDPDVTTVRLAVAAHRLLAANKDRPRNTTGSRRPGQELFVYGRAHRPCLRCGTPVREAPQDDRPTYWCPRCQTGPTPTGGPDPRTVAIRFNDRINAGDLDGLAALMSQDHTFIDTAETAVTGKQACLDAWRGFFAAFPDYRNVFTSVTAQGGLVTALGHSVCAEPSLAGPARWTAVVHDGKVTRWQVHENPPTPPD